METLGFVTDESECQANTVHVLDPGRVAFLLHLAGAGGGRTFVNESRGFWAFVRHLQKQAPERDEEVEIPVPLRQWVPFGPTTAQD